MKGMDILGVGALVDAAVGGDGDGKDAKKS
jgi:hypothetical protein